MHRKMFQTLLPSIDDNYTYGPRKYMNAFILEEAICPIIPRLYLQVVDKKKNGNTNVKSFNRVLGHHVQPVRPVCDVAYSSPASGILQERCVTILPEKVNQLTHV